MSTSLRDGCCCLLNWQRNVSDVCVVVVCMVGVSISTEHQPLGTQYCEMEVSAQPCTELDSTRTEWKGQKESWSTWSLRGP